MKFQQGVVHACPNSFRTALAVAAIVVGFLSGARADEVLFNNGDRLSGEVLSAEGGTLKIRTSVAGEVTVSLSDVKTFTTDKPLKLKMKSGERITAPAAAAEAAGKVKLQTDGQARDVSLQEVKYVNFSEAWYGAVVAGATVARGNTSSEDINASFDLNRRREIDRWTVTGGYNYGRQRNNDTNFKSTSTDNWFTTGKYDYFLTEKLYAFGSLRYEHDRIADLDYRLVPGAGLGYFWVDRPDFKFDTEAGLAYVIEKYGDGREDDFLSARFAYHLKKNLWDDKVAFFHDFEYYPSLERLDDFLVIADAGLRAAITGNMFAEYKFEYRYDATPAEGKHYTDLRHVVGIGWKF